MSKHPTERVRTVQELQATSMQQSDKALRRMAAAEERLARLEGRLAEKDQLISEFQEAYGRQADTITALTAVVRELEAKVGRGVDQVITGLEGRIAEIEREFPLADKELRELIQLNEHAVPSITAHSDLVRRVVILESKADYKPKRGRPKGSKNKPKSTPAVDNLTFGNAETTPQDGDSSNSKASDT